jgi:DegV family protein with EDD domain
LIKIITDTDASLPPDLAARYDIRQVPIIVQFGEEALKTGVDIDDAGLYTRVDREGKMPTTSAPAPGQFAEAYEAALHAGADCILCFCVSAEISATYGAAVIARDMFPEHDITVVDTRTVTMAQGFVALAAAEAVGAGATKEQAIARARSVGQRSHVYAALSTVKYLALSGRVGYLAAGMATLLNVKPILSVRDAKLDVVERVRTQKKAWARVIDLTGQALAGRPIERMAIGHVHCLDDALRFEQQVRASLPCPDEIIMTELSPGLSVHTGAGLIGIVPIAAE